MKESHLRSMTKAVSWRIFGTLATMLIVYVFTHKIAITFYVGVFEFISKIGLFYFHERVWGLVSFGLSKNNYQKITMPYKISKEPAR
jgi:uncharacterized membrane protein